MRPDLRNPRAIRRQNIRDVFLGIIGLTVIAIAVFAASYTAAGSHFIEAQAIHPDCMGDAKC
jgi:hypothetical protein